MVKQAETFDEKIISYCDEEIDNMFEINVSNIDLDEEEKEIIANEEIYVNKKEYDFLLNFYQENNKINYQKMSKNMEKVINETTMEFLEKMSNILFDKEQKSWKIKYLN